MASPNQENEIRAKKQKLETQLAELSASKKSKDLKKISAEYHEINKIVELLDKRVNLIQALNQAKEIMQSATDTELHELAESEIIDIDQKLKRINATLEDFLHPEDPADKKNILVEIRAAAGGDEAALFAAEIFRMYTRYAERHNWTTKLLNSNRTGIGGFKEVIFSIEGERVYSRLKYESGVHRVQRVPNTEKSGRVHTSTVTVAVMPEADEIDINIDPKDLEIKASTSTGAGGQSVNTTYSAVRIVHNPTGIVVQCQDERNFQQNKIRAMQVLRARLLDLERQKQQNAKDDKRKLQIGTGDRSEKIRTYNFSQDRVTDHRLTENFYGVEQILDGDIDEIIDKLKTASRATSNNK